LIFTGVPSAIPKSYYRVNSASDIVQYIVARSDPNVNVLEQSIDNEKSEIVFSDLLSVIRIRYN